MIHSEKNSDIFPNFLIIGVAKAGTDSLVHYLNQHPDIFIPEWLEPNFFAVKGLSETRRDFNSDMAEWDYKRQLKISIRSLEDYKSIFAEAGHCHAIGEKSPLYMYNLETAERIKSTLPNVKLIAILRNPVDRAYSHFRYRVQRFREPVLDFEHVVKLEPLTTDDIWVDYRDYLRRGFYYRQLKPYFERFDRSQIKVILFDDYRTDLDASLKEIFQFLDVNDSFVPNTSVKKNVSGFPRSKLLHRLLHIFLYTFPPMRKLRWRKTVLRSIIDNISYYYYADVSLSEDKRKQVIDFFGEDILQLQDLINVDLGIWM